MTTSKLIRNKILVLGRRGVGKLSIIKRNYKNQIYFSNLSIIKLIYLCNIEILSITNQSFNGLDIEDKNHSGIKIPWEINTKYYSTKVDFWIDETVHKDCVNKEVIQGYENEENGIGKVVDAILFVFKKDEVLI